MHNSLLCFWHLSCADHCFSGVLGTQCKVFSIHCSSRDLLYDTACVCISKFSTREPKSIFSSLRSVSRWTFSSDMMAAAPGESRQAAGETYSLLRSDSFFILTGV